MRRLDGALEELVRTVEALDGPRAEALLSGLCDARRPAALELLRGLEQCTRAERHARLASAFAPRAAPLGAAAGIPGRLGDEVRGRIAGGAPPEHASEAGPTERWARRLVVELCAG